MMKQTVGIGLKMMSSRPRRTPNSITTSTFDVSKSTREKVGWEATPHSLYNQDPFQFSLFFSEAGMDPYHWPTVGPELKGKFYQPHELMEIDGPICI